MACCNRPPLVLITNLHYQLEYDHSLVTFLRGKTGVDDNRAMHCPLPFLYWPPNLRDRQYELTGHARGGRQVHLP